MRTAYAVVSGSGDELEVHALCLVREVADAVAATAREIETTEENDGPWSPSYRVVEYPLLESADELRKVSWYSVVVGLAGEELSRGDWQHAAFGDAGDLVGTAVRSGSIVYATSTSSYEDALERARTALEPQQ
jgi:hypothetical protein